MGSGTADGTTYLRGDGTWASPVAAPLFLKKTSSYTITSSDAANGLILVHTVSFDSDITLPLASSVPAGKTIKISGVGNYLNVLTSSSDVMTGVYMQNATNIRTALGSRITWVELISDGLTTWYITGIVF